jgi:hypothetical protein
MVTLAGIAVGSAGQPDAQADCRLDVAGVFGFVWVDFAGLPGGITRLLRGGRRALLNFALPGMILS